ncbi:MAG: glycoside hydrolase family 31 protein [Lachnospiraceae bacterium]|nr:glycoside hydrolase family 31 protein [Lachnospiraceae bacterium]
MNKLYVTLKSGTIYIEVIREDVFRCVYTKGEVQTKTSDLLVKHEQTGVSARVTETDSRYEIATAKLRLVIDLESEICTWYNGVTGECYVQEAGKSLMPVEVVHYTTGGEEPVIDRVKTVDGERNFIRNLKPQVDRQAYRGKLSFQFSEKEGIYGLGQGEEGIYNYRGHVQYLYQHNMRIPMPVFVSSRSYGIFLDCSSLMTFNDDENGSYIFMDTVDQMDYYFMAGQCLDDVIDGYRYLTGQAVMLPKWAFGYVQSREAYHTGEELVETVQKYRDLEVPLDCIVQDWNTWEPGNWGEKKVDRKRFPNLGETMGKIHDMHVHTMVSVWPNMNPGGDNHTEFFKAGYLLNDYSTYNALSEEARAMYWKQAREELFSGGFDSWWCDSTEPFSGPDWGGEVKREPWERYELVGGEHKAYLDPAQANAFALYHARGIFENQRKDTKEKRVLNLTRSGYASSQRYGTMLWSGDTCATWDNFKKQITEGLNFAMSGMPYWTLDIGAFFTVGSAWQNRGCNCSDNPNPLWFWQGDYNEGVGDAAYRELYVRWLQMGAFLPMFRSHGTDTPREIWNFGKKGEMFYDAIETFIKLRYHLMPYTYSLAGAVYRKNRTMMRSLLFDFAEDETACAQKDQFLFGESILVCPVTEPMYYEVGNKPLDKEKKRNCYLPQKALWYDYWTNTVYQGGQWVSMDAPMDRMPLFVKGGSIIPTAENMQYAQDPAGKDMTLCIYPGVDASYELYEDEGDNYNYEEGAYSLIPMKWDEKEKCLTVQKRQGAYPGMDKTRTFTVRCMKDEKTVTYDGENIEIKF